MTLLSAFRIDVLEAFKALKTALTSLESALEQDEALPAWFLPPQELAINSQWTIRAQAHRLICQLEYLDGQKPREILVGAGLIAASENTIQSIIDLNHCKDRFKEAMLALKKANIKMNDPFLCEHFEPLLEKCHDFYIENTLQAHSHLHQRTDPTTRGDLTANTLKKAGLSRLHLKQCYRRIPFFLERPIKVSWTWANTKAITRITIEKARQLLLKQHRDAGIELQLAKLEALSSQEPLAIVQELAPHLRANVVFCNDGDLKDTEEPDLKNKNGRNDRKVTTSHLERRVMVKGPIPLFYLAKGNEVLPRIRPPGVKRGKDKQRRIRSDVKLEEEAYLPAIRAHRYNSGVK